MLTQSELVVTKVLKNPTMDSIDKEICYKMSQSVNRRQVAIALYNWVANGLTVGAIALTALIHLQPGLNYHLTTWYQGLEILKAPNGWSTTLRQGNEAVPESSGLFTFPVSGLSLETAQITSAFGRRHIFGGEDFHEGIDIAVGSDAEIVASISGRVEAIQPIVSDNSQYQIKISSQHNGRKVEMFYIHVTPVEGLAIGYNVEQGELIARVAATTQKAREEKISTGNHFDIRGRFDGEWVDPRQFLSNQDH